MFWTQLRCEMLLAVAPPGRTDRPHPWAVVGRLIIPRLVQSSAGNKVLHRPRVGGRHDWPLGRHRTHHPAVAENAFHPHARRRDRKGTRPPFRPRRRGHGWDAYFSAEEAAGIGDGLVQNRPSHRMNSVERSARGAMAALPKSTVRCGLRPNLWPRCTGVGNILLRNRRRSHPPPAVLTNRYSPRLDHPTRFRFDAKPPR